MLPSYVIVILTTHGITVSYWVEVVGALAVLPYHCSIWGMYTACLTCFVSESAV